jgi:hypothetical protein
MASVGVWEAIRRGGDGSTTSTGVGPEAPGAWRRRSERAARRRGVEEEGIGGGGRREETVVPACVAATWCRRGRRRGGRRPSFRPVWWRQVGAPRVSAGRVRQGIWTVRREAEPPPPTPRER